MKLPSNKALLINAGIVLTILFAAIVGVRDFFIGRTEPICTERYSKMALLPLERGGQLLKPEDIQASANGQDHGVMTNMSIRRLKDAPAVTAMGVKLEAGTAHANGTAQPQGGVSLPWRPRGVPADLSAGCLTYHVFLPADFDFEDGGTLPGLFGLSEADGKVTDRADVRFVWGGAGTVHQFMFADTPESSAQFTTPANVHGAPMPVGRWVRIDQEVILNSPGVGNGKTRLWIDQVLRAEIRNADLRDNVKLAIQGVTMDVHFGQPTVDGRIGSGRARKTEEIWITPFQLRFN